MKKVDLKAATKSAQTKVNAHIRNISDFYSLITFSDFMLSS